MYCVTLLMHGGKRTLIHPSHEFTNTDLTGLTETWALEQSKSGYFTKGSQKKKRKWCHCDIMVTWILRYLGLYLPGKKCHFRAPSRGVRPSCCPLPLCGKDKLFSSSKISEVGCECAACRTVDIIIVVWEENIQTFKMLS